jgi:hypothetical protein
MGGTSLLILSSWWVVTGGASEANASRGEYIEYFEDSAKGCAFRLEKPHCVPKIEPDAEIGQKGHLWMGTN